MQMFSHFPGKEGLSMRNDYFGRHTITTNVLPFLLFSPQFLLLSITYRLSCWSDGVSCPGCVHSQLLAHPQAT